MYREQCIPSFPRTGTVNAQIRIRRAGSIDDIGRALWDGLEPRSPFMSYGWLKTLEEVLRDNGRPVYYLLEQGAECLAASVCYVASAAERNARIDRFILGGLSGVASRFGITSGPVFRLGPLHGYGEHLLLSPGLDPRRRASCIHAMVDRIERDAAHEGASLFAFNVSERQHELYEVLVNRGYHRTAAHPKNRLDIRWQSFDEYLSDQSAVTGKMRRTIRLQMRKNVQAGVCIRESSENQDKQTLYRLVRDHHLRLNGASYPYTERLFDSLEEHLGPKVLILVAEKGGDTVGVSVMLRHRDSGWTSFIGLDHARTGNDFSYFNIGYYEIIRRAIEMRLQTLYYGDMMYRVKRRRGCRLEQSHVFHKSAGALRHAIAHPWFVFHRLWYEKRKIPRVLRER